MKKAKKEKEPKHSPLHILKNIIYILKLSGKYTPELIAFPLIESVVFGVMNFLAYTYSLSLLINGYQDGKPFPEMLLMLLCIYGTYFLCQIGISAYYNLRRPAICLMLDRAIKMKIFEKNRTVDLGCYEDKAFFDKYVKASGDLKDRIWNVIGSIDSVAWMFVSGSLSALYILTIDPGLLLFALAPFVLNLIFGKKNNDVNHEYTLKRQEQERQRDYTRRTFYLKDFAKEMRLTSMHRVMFDRFGIAVDNILAYIRKYGVKTATFDYILREGEEIIGTFGATAYAIYRTLVSGTMELGDCLVVVNSVGNVSWIVASIASTYNEFHAHSLFIDTIRDYLEYQPKILPGTLAAPASGELCLKNVSFRYAGQSEDVLHDITLTIHAGEKIALVGHNGSGKSTLVKLLLRLYDPTEGTITYAGGDIRSYLLDGEDGYRDRFGTVFQDYRLFSMSVTENVLLERAKEGDDERVKQALVDAGIWDKIASFTNGTETILTREFDENGQVLSGGEGQKIAIARAFAKQGSFLLLDEPSSALDPIAEYQMYQSMMKAAQGRAVVFISHRLSSAVLADRIYLLENGRIIEEGSHHDLMARGGKYAELFTLQARNYILPSDTASDRKEVTAQ